MSRNYAIVDTDFLMNLTLIHNKQNHCNLFIHPVMVDFHCFQSADGWMVSNSVTTKQIAPKNAPIPIVKAAVHICTECMHCKMERFVSARGYHITWVEKFAEKIYRERVFER